MQEAFSFNREYDYVRLEGLSRATGRPAHEWDLYILKELIDNALDADEVLWNEDPLQAPSLRIHMEYISVPPPQKQQLLVRVGNRARFPIERIQDIFATQWYTSRKAFLKGLERGSLGNALKTLLGIAYALHQRVADNWKPDLKPLSISFEGTEYLPRYIIDSLARTITLEIDVRSCRPVDGTMISVGLDYFVQEIPRTLAELRLLAQQYHLCNPHVNFTWSVEIENQLWKEEYTAQTGWTNKFRGLAPIQWYSLSNFKSLLGALYREHSIPSGSAGVPLQHVCRYFPGAHGPSTSSGHIATIGEYISQEIGQSSLTAADIEGAQAKALYAALGKCSPAFRSSMLGSIGREQVYELLTRCLPLDGKIHYALASEADDDPSLPFVIEAAVAYLKEGKRQIWTHINFSPTYNDPFLNRWLPVSTPSQGSALGLRGLLDAYGFHEDTPIILFLHLICPTVEYHEFSKTEINHLPFKKIVGEMLLKLLTELRQGREEEEMQLEQTIFQALNTIMNNTRPGEQFSFEQLLEQLRLQLSLNQTLTNWLERPDTLDRLQAYITSYQSYQPEMKRFVARQAEVVLHVPSHPKYYFSVPLEHTSQDILNHYYVNKILYVQSQALESVIVANNWLCRMDMALLHAPLDFNLIEEAFLQCIRQSEIPILVLHDADEAGYAFVEQLRSRIEQRQLDAQRVIDITVPQEVLDNAPQLTKLGPGELESWLLARFETLGIDAKHMPPPASMRKDIRERFEHLLQSYLLEKMRQRFALTALLIDFDNALTYTRMMMEEALDEQLRQALTQKRPTDSYNTVLESTIEEFFEQFMSRCGSKVRQMEQAWLAQRLDGQSR